MTLKRHLLLAMLVLVTLTAGAKNKLCTVYMYGFAASFNDSTVYFTDIIQMDSAYVDEKTGFLYSRDDYSHQLRNYLVAQGFKNMTCITSFALKRKDAEKKFANLRKRYIAGNHYDVNYLTADKFTYIAVELDEAAAQVEQQEKPKKPKGEGGFGQGGPGGGGPGGGGPGGGMSGMGGGQPPMR